jgi:hypothetical protein
MKFTLRDISSPSNAKRAQASRAEYFEGYGSPSGVVTANMGAIYLNLNGGASTSLYVKETGFNTNTGWVAYGAGSPSGWIDTQIFTATASQVDFVITNFAFDANSKLTVLYNGLDIDEGGGLDWVRNVALTKITTNEGVTANARIKVVKWA